MGNNEERWRELCARAAVEQDPQKLMELVEEITRLLAKRQKSQANVEREQKPET